MARMEKCSSCGAERKYLHRHHIIPKSSGGTDDESNIQRLCSNCHEDIHGGSGFDEVRRNPELSEKRNQSHREYFQTEKGREHLSRMIVASAEVFKDPERLNARNVAISESWTPEKRAEKAEQMRQLRAERHWSTKTDGSLKALSEHRATAIANSVATRRRERVRECISCGKLKLIQGHNMCGACYMRWLRNQKQNELNLSRILADVKKEMNLS